MEFLINELIQKKREKTIAFLQRLIREDSTRGNESNAQAIIIEKCRKLGLQLDIFDIDHDCVKHHPFYSCDRENFSGNPNVVATLKGYGQNGRSILLNSHIDVVPTGNEKEWTMASPFSGERKNGKVYGRGTSDMKGGTVSLLLALEVIKELPVTLLGDCVFQSVIEEESGGTGTLSCLLNGYTADAAIIPEPTNMKLFPKQQGSMWFRLTVNGKGAHGGTRYNGKNAILLSRKVIDSLLLLEQIRNNRIVDPLYESVNIPIPINIGRIIGGDWPSSVPDKVIMEGRYGVAPEESMEDAQRELQQLISRLNDAEEWFNQHPIKLEWFGGKWQSSTLSLDHPILSVIKQKVKEVSGKEAILEASPWGTDGGILSKGGDIPVVIFGPGETSLAHQANEWILEESIFSHCEIIVRTILEWCGYVKKE
ncbi:acetylornithine deacetylase [Bacillus coahuilensis m2-6]|uniref:peptidase n=1 Tax=Bacillus coahuilensis TaxID=408580 RepID=UPI0001850C2E|nr:peptidase [Bacillus coahuilensis]KUP07967.1 acetylornithine deacetylase [Bacillus coahuilensis m2-6]